MHITELTGKKQKIQQSEKAFHAFAEDYVYLLEVKRANSSRERAPLRMNTENNKGNVHCGYDIDSYDRHIEVKSFLKKKTYKDLTPRQTEVLISDPSYFVYIVEFNAAAPLTPDVYAIPQLDLIAMHTVKTFYRLNGISNQEKRVGWKLQLD